jgi:hypothetical protein
LSLSTATPSLGGTLPKLATLKIGYEVPRYNYQQGLRGCTIPTIGFDRSEKLEMFRKSTSMREKLSLASSALDEADEGSSPGTINVLATQAEASMSSTSFTIPRRSTIDADVRSFFIL